MNSAEQAGTDEKVLPTKANKHRCFQEILFEELRSVHCYLCGKWITKDPVYVGQAKWRHKRCRPVWNSHKD